MSSTSSIASSLAKTGTSRPSSVVAMLPYLILLFDAVLLAYANVYGNAFVYDDFFLIGNNPLVQNPIHWPKLFVTFLLEGSDTPSFYYRPLQALFYGIVYWFSGLQTGGFHLLNVLLHAANACLVYVLGRRLGFHPWAVFAAALLWALHPVHVESVAYISATADPLYSLFCLSGALVLWPDCSPRRVAFASLFFVLGLLSKESALSFPLLAAAILYFGDAKRLDLRSYVRLGPLALIGIVYVALHVHFAARLPHHDTTGNITLSAAASGLQPFAALPVYLRLWLAPFGLCMSHALALSGPLWVAQVALGFAVVVGAAACVVRRQTPALIPLSFGLLWFFAALFPSITAGNIVYEHWLYLPMAGLMLGAAEAFARWADARKAFAPRERKVFLVLLAATALMLGALTARQNLVWRDSETLYQNVIRSGDPAPNAHLNLGAAYAGRGGYEAALEEYKLAERDFALSNDTFTGDGRPPLETARARALLALGGAAREDEALRHLERALTKDPLYLAALDTLASYYAKQGNTRMAEETKARAEAVRQKIGSLMKPDY